MTSITVVTPWFEHRELEKDYWDAMKAADAKVLIVDNGSEPPLPNGIRLDYNSGFAPACNIGLELAQTDAVLFLNNDISLERPDWLTSIVEALEPGVLVGADLRWDDHGDVGGEKMPYLDGWCVAGMKEDLVDIGGWDEEYEEPSYFGDNDLSLRARADGMVLREAKVGLFHKLNITAGDGLANYDVTMRNKERYMARAKDLLGVAA